MKLPEAPAASSPAARRTMLGNRSRDSKPELRLRREMHRLGLRYRVDAALPLPGVRRRADAVFAGARVAVFLDGCYWHACPDHGTVARTNATYWTEKIRRNAERDRDTDARLSAVGWLPLRFWEHEDPAHAAERVLLVVRERRHSRAGTRRCL